MNDLESRLAGLLDRKAADADVAPIKGFGDSPLTTDRPEIIETRTWNTPRWNRVALGAAAAVIVVVAVSVVAVVGQRAERSVSPTPDTDVEQTSPTSAATVTALPTRSPAEIKAGLVVELATASASDTLGAWTGRFNNDGSTRFAHRVRGFTSGALKWTVADYAEPGVQGIQQGTMLMTPFGDVTANSTNPVCCGSNGDSDSWVLFHDLPATVEYLTFESGTRWQRPVEGVAIVPATDVTFYDASGRPLNLLLPTPEQFDVAAAVSHSTSFEQVINASTSRCLADAGFDIYATDASSLQQWTTCLQDAIGAATTAGATSESLPAP